MTNNRIKNILKSLDSIISEIKTYNNDFLSKYLMFVLILVIIVLDMSLFEAIFGKINLFFKIIMFYASIVTFLLLMILINTTSSVYFEANKSYKLLNKLFITIDKNKISINIKIKIWFQRFLFLSFENYSYILFITVTDVIIYWENV